jgi:hypothetical protein
MSEALAVDAVDLTKTYGALTAVDRITVQVGHGEVYGRCCVVRSADARSSWAAPKIPDKRLVV